MKKWLLTIAALVGLIGPVPASQYDFGTIIPELTSGSQLASHLNQWRNALHTLHAGSSRPSYAVAGTMWVDSSGSPWLLKVYTGSIDITLGPIDSAMMAGRLTVGSARPTYAATGTLWVNTSTGSPVLNYYNGAADISMGPIAAEGLGVAPGVEAPFAGIFPPTGWLLEYGQEVSRTTYASLMNAIAPSFSCNTTNGQVGLGTGTNFVGTGLGGYIAKLEGPGIPANTTVVQIYDATGMQMSNAATSTSAGTCRIFPHGNGNASSTFNVPDRRGRVVAGRDTMGNTNAGRLEVYFGDYLGSAGGTENILLSSGQMPNHSHSGTFSSGWADTQGNHAHNYTVRNELLTVDADDGGGAISGVWRSDNTAGSSTTGNHNHNVSGTVTVGSTGGGTATPLMQPTGVSNYIIKY